MTFFYDLNKRLATIASQSNKTTITEGAKPDYIDLDRDGNKTEPMKQAARQAKSKEVDEASYSAKAARAGKDIGKPGKTFAKIAKSAGERYGSKERGEKVAGAVLAKLRAKEGMEEGDEAETMPKRAPQSDTATFGRQKGIGYRLEKNPEGKWDISTKDKKSHIQSRLGKHVAPALPESDMDESALQAYLGKKKYGEEGMKALQKAGREGASKEKMSQIRARHDKMDEADMEEGNRFTGNLAKARAAGKKEADLDGDGDMERVLEKKEKTLWPGTPEYEKKFPKTMKTGEKSTTHKGGEVEKTATGIKHTARYDDDAEDTKADDGAPKRRGRPKGSKKAMGAKFTGKSKLLQKGAIKEQDVEEDQDQLVDRGEFDREGDMAKEQLNTIEAAAQELHDLLSDDQNLPEWVQSKITKAMDYIDTARDYMLSQDAEADQEEPVAEKAVSKAQQKFMGMAHAMQKGEKIPGASKELKKVAKTMKKGDVEDFAKTKHKGLPEKVKSKKEESVEETKDEAPKASKGGFQFGKGIYDSWNRDVENLIAESMNISMNMNNDPEGGASKSLTVSATDEDAVKLAALLKMAGVGDAMPDDQPMEEAYGDTEPTETKPDYPTNTETSDDALQYSGGLNKPKETGQTTVPVIASQLERQVTDEDDAMGRTGDDITLGEEDELARIREMAGIRK